MRFSYYIHHYRDYTRPDLPSGGEGEVSGSSNVPDLSAALAGILVGASTPYHLMLSHCICGTQNEKSPIVAFHVHGFCLPDQAKLPGPRLARELQKQLGTSYVHCISITSPYSTSSNYTCF